MTTVIIWNNNNMISRISTKLSHYTVGHAALNINDNWGWCNIKFHPYVSWWKEPEIAYSRDENLVAKDLQRDLMLSSYAPDHVIRISNIKLDTKKMISTWEAIRNKKILKYNEAFNNCTTIVSRVLLAGVRSKFSFTHKRIIWTPLQLKRVAYNLGGHDISWSYFMNELKQYCCLNEVVECLKDEGRRSSRHGYAGAAKPRFVNGIDTLNS
ncbi:MAG: hypothetical protein PUP46_01580 [Endozoicomonas sp. (ex Botrylloides leachii)]|nr:hypothetical protein [Endozoicomonas sp. (ex Botrylloides leachii)]